MSQKTPPTRQPAPRASAPRESLLRRLPRGSGRWFLLGAAILAAGVALQLLWPGGFPLEGEAGSRGGVSEIHGAGPIRINELMSKNNATLADENGLTPDWIEVANIGPDAVNLYGYALARDARAANVFRFPDLTLEPGTCAVVFADSTPGESAVNAPFNLPSAGGSLLLFNRKGTEIDSVTFPALAADVAYARVGESAWEARETATPGLLNTEENERARRTPDASVGVEITEVVAGNTRYAPDAKGQCYDYFELHNTTGAALDLSGWFVSDDPARPVKWRLPEGFALQADEYRIVYASKLDRADPDAPHAGFGLSSGGEAVLLSDATGALVDLVEYGRLEADTAWLRHADGTWSAGTPSPAAAND